MTNPNLRLNSNPKPYPNAKINLYPNLKPNKILAQHSVVAIKCAYCRIYQIKTEPVDPTNDEESLRETFQMFDTNGT